MSNLIGPALVHIRAAERDGVAARTMPAVRRLSISWDPPGAPRRALCWCQGQKRNCPAKKRSTPEPNTTGLNCHVNRRVQASRPCSGGYSRSVPPRHRPPTVRWRCPPPPPRARRRVARLAARWGPRWQRCRVGRRVCSTASPYQAARRRPSAAARAAHPPRRSRAASAHSRAA